MKTLFNCLAVVSLSLFAFGCGPGMKVDSNPPAKPADDHREHAHGEHGPHQGEIIELGKEEYHAELCHDEKTKKVTIYLLDKEAKKAVTIGDKEITFNLVAGAAPQQFKILAVPQAADAAGQSSRFELVDEKLCDLVGTKGSKARLNVTINGTPYSGEYTVEEDHAHDHEQKK